MAAQAELVRELAGLAGVDADQNQFALNLREVGHGSYRILYQLTDRGATIRVAAIRPRAIAYRREPR